MEWRGKCRGNGSKEEKEWRKERMEVKRMRRNQNEKKTKRMARRNNRWNTVEESFSAIRGKILGFLPREIILRQEQRVRVLFKFQLTQE